MSATPTRGTPTHVQSAAEVDDDQNTLKGRELYSLQALKVRKGQNTRASIWNMLGDNVDLVTSHDWSGKVYPSMPYPQEIRNGCFGHFVHLKDLKNNTSAGAVVYTGLNVAGSQFKFVVAWSNAPSAAHVSGKLAYTEILDAETEPNWDKIYDRLISGTDSDKKYREGLISTVKWLYYLLADPELEITFELDHGLYN